MVRKTARVLAILLLVAAFFGQSVMVASATSNPERKIVVHMDIQGGGNADEDFWVRVKGSDYDQWQEMFSGDDDTFDVPNASSERTYTVTQDVDDDHYSSVSVIPSSVTFASGAHGTQDVYITNTFNPFAIADSANFDYCNPRVAQTLDVLNNDIGTGLSISSTSTAGTQGTVSRNWSSTSHRYTSISYTPPANPVGTSDSFTYTAEATDHCVSTATVTVNFATGTLVVAKDVPNLERGIGDTFSFTVTRGSTTVDTFTLARGESKSISGLLCGQYTVSETGVDQDYTLQGDASRTVAVTHAGPVTATFSNVYSGPNLAPVAASDLEETTQQATPVTVDVLTNDFDNDGDYPLVITGIGAGTSGLPQHGSAVITGDTIVYTPEFEFAGTDEFMYTINDTHGAAAGAWVMVTVTPRTPATLTIHKDIIAHDGLTKAADTEAPTFVAEVRFGGTAVRSNVRISEGDSGEATVSLPSGLTYEVVETGGADFYTYVSGATLTLSAEGSNKATITNQYLPNHAPVANDAKKSTYVNVPVVITVTGSDEDNDLAEQAVDFTEPEHGKLVQSEANEFVFTYTPDANFYGEDSFEFSLMDQHEVFSESAIVDIDVLGGKLIVKKQMTGNSGFNPQLGFPVTVDSGEGMQTTRSFVNPSPQPLPVNADFNLYPNGSETLYVAPGEYIVSEGDIENTRYAFVSITSDGDSREGEGNALGTYVGDGDTVTVTITNSYTAPFNPPPPAPLNTPPVAKDDIASTTADGSVVISILTNDTDADGDVLLASITTLPTNGTVTIADGKITYTPNAGFSGNDSFTYTINDGRGGSSTATVKVTVAAKTPTEPPVVVIDEPIPGGGTTLPKTGGVDPVMFYGIGLAAVVLGAALRKRNDEE